MCRKTTCFKENIFDRHRAMRQGTFRYRWANRCFWKRFKWPGLLGRNGLDQWCPVGPPPHRLKLVRRLIWVTNGRADNKSDTSEVPQLTDPLCATRKSAESYVSAYSTGGWMGAQVNEFMGSNRPPQTGRQHARHLWLVGYRTNGISRQVRRI
jgi:hypothetical protein